MNQKELVDKLTDETKQLENKIEHIKLYNIRNFVISSLMKSGIVIDYALPFILAAIIVANSQISEGNAPFKTDEIVQKAGIETIDTSSGIHVEHISYDFSYDDEILEYSTGWFVNDSGLYQRTVTSYELNNWIDLGDNETILRMTKEEIDDSLIITNVKTIQKHELSPEDFIYGEDALIVVNHTFSEELAITRPETLLENTVHSISFIVLSICGGGCFIRIERLFKKTYIRDKIREYEPLFRMVDEEKLEEMKKILEIKRQNLAMITPSENIEDNGYSYKLRRG